LEVIFLGTGGARVIIQKQLRATGGFRINGSLNLYFDPGPGALLRNLQFQQNPAKIDILFLSHCHVDHVNDANLFIEAMTENGKKRDKAVLGSVSVLEGNEKYDRIVTRYHQAMVDKYITMKAGDKQIVKGVKIEATPTKHTDETTVGFKISMEGKVIGYASDTEYFKELGEVFVGCDLLILNNLRPFGQYLAGHLTSDGVAKILKVAKPKKAVIQHFGMRMLRAGPEVEAKTIEKASGIETIAAKDGMRIEFGKTKESKLIDFEE
jgi:ribonuclease BN (tRNA processing enzyme)